MRRFCRKVRFLGQNPKIGYQKFNDFQTAKLSKKQLCDRTQPVAPIRHLLAIKDTPVAHTRKEMTPSTHHATGCAAYPSILFSPPGNGFSTLDARWKLLI